MKTVSAVLGGGLMTLCLPTPGTAQYKIFVVILIDIEKKRYNTAFRSPFAPPTQFFLFSSTIALLYDKVGQQRLNTFP